MTIIIVIQSVYVDIIAYLYMFMYETEGITMCGRDDFLQLLYGV